MTGKLWTVERIAGTGEQAIRWLIAAYEAKHAERPAVVYARRETLGDAPADVDGVMVRENPRMRVGDYVLSEEHQE